jgi:hypothetical protein
MKNISTLIIVSFAVSGCTQSTQVNNQQASIKTEVRNTIENYFVDIRRKGFSAEFTYLDSSDNFFWIPPGYRSALSFDSVAVLLRNNAQIFESINNSIDTLIVLPMSNRFVGFSQKVNSIILDSFGKVSKITFWETGIMIKRESGWKFLCGQTSILNR